MRRPLSQDRPTLYRHETIELSEKRIKLRVVLLILAVAAAAVSFACGINALFSTEPGVREITALTGEMNSGGEFTFYYHLGAGETSADGLFSLELVNCLGSCALAPVMVVDDTYYGKVTLEKLPEILNKYREEAAG